MKKTKTIKIIISILIAITLFFAFYQNTFALNYDVSTKFENQTDKSEATNKITGVFGSVINFAQVFGAGFAIIMLVVIGIKWVYAAPSGKAQIAKTSIYYIMGAVFIFTAVAILQIIKNFTNASIGNI